MLEPEKYSLFDRSTNERKEMPVQQVQEAINSGRFVFGNEQKIPLLVKDREGNEKVFPVSPGIARKYMRRGAKWLSPKAHTFQKDEEVYGDDIGDDILAGLTGVVDGLGFVDEFSRGLGALGVPGLRERVIHNPVPHALGTMAVNVPLAVMAAAGMETPFAPVAAPIGLKAAAKVGIATKALYKALGVGKKGFDLTKGALRPIAKYTPGYQTARISERFAGGVAGYAKAQDHWSTAERVAAVGAARVGAQALESGFYGAGYAASELDLKDLGSPDKVAEYVLGRAGWSALIGVGAQLGFAVGIPVTVGGVGWAARGVDRSWDWFADTNLARNLENVAADIQIKAKQPMPMIGESKEAAKIRREGEIKLSIGIGKEARKKKEAVQSLATNLSELKVHMVDTMTEAYDMDLTVKAHEQNGHSQKALGETFRNDLENINPLDTIEEAIKVLALINEKISLIRKAGQGKVAEPEKGWTKSGKPREQFIDSADYDPTLIRWEKRAREISELINKTLIDTADAKIYPDGKVREAHQTIIADQVADVTGNATRIEFVDIDRDFVSQKAPDIDTTGDIPYVFMVKNVDRDVPRGIPDELDESRWMRGEPEETIYFDYKRATEAFSAEKKPWNNPTLKGVRPLQEIFYELQKRARQGDGEFKSSLFPSSRDWVEFLVHHELAHVETPRETFMESAINDYLSSIFGYRFSHLTADGQKKIAAPLDNFRERLAEYQRNRETLEELNEELGMLKRGEETESGRSEKQVEEAIKGFEDETVAIDKAFGESVENLERVFRSNTRDDIIGDERVHQIVQDTMEASGRRADDLTDQLTGLGLYTRRKIEIIKERIRNNTEGQAISRAKRLEGEDGQDELLLKLRAEEATLIEERKALYDFKRVIGKGFPERKELDYTRIPGAASDVQAIEAKILKVEEQIKTIINRSLREPEDVPGKPRSAEHVVEDAPKPREGLGERGEREQKLFREISEDINREGPELAQLEQVGALLSDPNMRVGFRMAQDGSYTVHLAKTDQDLVSGNSVEIPRSTNPFVDDIISKLMLLGGRDIGEIRPDAPKAPTREEAPKVDGTPREDDLGPFGKFLDDVDDDLRPAKSLDEEERLNKDYESVKELIAKRDKLVVESRNRILSEDRRAGEGRVKLEALRKQKAELLKRLATAGDKKRIPHDDEVRAKADIAEVKAEIKSEEAAFVKLAGRIDKIEESWKKLIQGITKLNKGNDDFKGVLTEIDTRPAPDVDEPRDLSSDILELMKGRNPDRIIHLGKYSSGANSTYSREFRELLALRKEYKKLAQELEAKEDGLMFLKRDFLPEKEDWLKELVEISQLKFYDDKKKSFSATEIQEIRDEYEAVQAALIRAYQEVSPTLPKTLPEVFSDIAKLEAERIEIYKRAREIQKDGVGKGDKPDDRFYEITQELDQLDHIEHIIKTSGDSGYAMTERVETIMAERARGYFLPQRAEDEMLSSVNRNILRQIDNKIDRMLGFGGYDTELGKGLEGTRRPFFADQVMGIVKEAFGRRRDELLTEFYGRFDNEDVRMNIEEGKALSGGALQKAHNSDLNIANLLQKRKLLNEVLMKESAREKGLPDDVSEKEIALGLEVSRVESEIRSRTRKKFSRSELVEYNKRLIARISKTYKELDALGPDGDPDKKASLIRELSTLSENVSDTELRIKEFRKDSDLLFEAELNNLETGIRINRGELERVFTAERARVKEVEKTRKKIASLIREFEELDRKSPRKGDRPSEHPIRKSYLYNERRKLEVLERDGLENIENIKRYKSAVDGYHSLLDELDYARRSNGNTGDAEILAVDEARLQGIKRRVLELRDYSHQLVKVHPEAAKAVDPIAEFNKANRTQRGEGAPLTADEVLSRVDTNRATSELTGEPVTGRTLGSNASYENYLNKRALENSAALDLFSPVDPRSPLHNDLRNANRNTGKIFNALRSNPPASGKSHNSVKNPVQFLSKLYSQLEALSSDVHLAARQKHIQDNAEAISGVNDLKNLIRKFISSSEEYDPKPNNLTEGTGKETWGRMAEEKSQLDRLLKEQSEAYLAIEEKFIGKDPSAPLEKKASIEAISKWVENINYITKDDELKIIKNYLDTTVELLETLLGRTVDVGGRTRFEPGRYLNFEGLPKAEKLARYNQVKKQLKSVEALRDRLNETIEGIRENTEPALRYWEDIQREYEAGQDLDFRGDLAVAAGAGSLGFFFGGPLGAGAAMMAAGGAKAVAGAGANPKKAGAKLNMIRAMTDRFKEGIDNTVNDYFDGYLATVVSYERKHPFTKQKKPYHYRKKVTGGAIWPKALTSNAVARIMHKDPEEHFKESSGENAKYSDGRQFGREEFYNTRRIVKTLKERPETMEIVMNKAFGSVNEFAPEIAESLREGAKSSIDRLYGKLPEEIPTNNIFEESYPPSDYDIAQFGDYLALEEFGIYAALDFLEEGSWTPDLMSYLAQAKPHQTIAAQEISIDRASSPELIARLPVKVRNGLNLFLNYKNTDHLTEIYQETYMGQKKGPQAGPGGGAPMNLPGGETMGGIVERANIGVV